jgi:hypothetical protein
MAFALPIKRRRDKWFKLKVAALFIIGLMVVSRPVTAACFSGGSLINLITGAIFSGSFNPNTLLSACGLLDIPFVRDFAGGEQTATYFMNSWNDSILPGMKDMTKQLHAASLTRSLFAGMTLDAQNLNKTFHTLALKEDEARKRTRPSETTCAAATPLAALSRTNSLSKSLNSAIATDLRRRSDLVQGTPQGTSGIAGDLQSRFKRYCDYLQHASDNGGETGCGAAATAPAARGDVYVEHTLFRDTINLADVNERMATQALLENLVEPRISGNLKSEATMKSSPGQESQIRRRDAMTIRNLSYTVVGGIVSRRAAISDTIIGPQIQDIRERAGIPVDERSNMPSYNEIMLAMTKERFLDPAYAIRTKDDIAVIRQEQVAVDAYTSMVMSDIKLLQEQVNAMMAVRNSLLVNKVPLVNVDATTPGGN